MTRMGLVFTVAALLWLSACSEPKTQTGSAPQAEAPAPPTVFDETTATMDRARAVQGTVDEHARDLEQAEQAQGR